MVCWINQEGFRRVYVDGELVRNYNPRDDLPVLREQIIRKMQLERNASALNSMGEILSHLYDGEMDKIVDNLGDVLGL